MARPRRLSLQQVFQPETLRKTFVKHVWDALRDQQCNDLIFYYDYRRTLDNRAEQLSLTIAQGNYRPKASLAIAISKADMLARNMHIPHPDDALVLQVVSETLMPFIERKKPSPNAFFARSHQEHAGLHTQSQLQIYPWFRQWPRYQENILKFAKTKNFLVITDVLNFFDSVGFSHIRRRVQDEVAQSQQVVDLMLLLFENFIRRDMYAPITLQGIPTIDVDAPRLVGHAMLFPVDLYLKKNTGKCFARWMDDINFGVESIREARERIRDIDQILRTMGLRLAGGKTKILSYEKAREYLQADENQRLNIIQTRIKTNKAKITSRDASTIGRGLLRFRATPQDGYWDKVMRRYYGLIGRANRALVTKSPSFAKLVRRIEIISRKDFSDITTSEYRESIIKFWETLPATDARVSFYLEAFEEVQGYDDAVAFALGRMLATVRLSKSQTTKISEVLLRLSITAENPGYFFSAAWFLAKHGSEKDVVQFINRTKTLWEANYFFARQAVALWSLLPASSNTTHALRDTFLRSHNPDITSALTFLENLRTTAKPDDSLRGVLPMNPSIKVVDLRRVIISSNVMRSTTLDIQSRSLNAKRIDELIHDRQLRHLALGGTAR